MEDADSVGAGYPAPEQLKRQASTALVCEGDRAPE